ncbi:MAG: thermonuclease family protein [Rhodospirillales bacterium]
MRLFIFAVLASCNFILSQPANATEDISGIPTSISDGDTLKVSGETIRFFGIDTPEKAQLCARADGSCYKCGQTSGDALRNMIGHGGVVCKPTGSKTYGRWVAVCYSGSLNLNLEMARQGHATVYHRYLNDIPELKPLFEAAEVEAKERGRGIFQGEFIPPEQWRNQNKRLSCEQ